MKIRDIFTSWDFWVALVFAIAEWILLPASLLNKTLVNFYYITCTVSAIIFAFYLGGFAIIVSSPADDFLRFAEKKRLFTQLLDFFKFTLWLLSLGLVLSIIGYCVSSYLADKSSQLSFQPTYWFVIYSFIFWYGLFAGAISVQTTMTFAQYKNKFLSHRKHTDSLLK